MSTPTRVNTAPLKKLRRQRIAIQVACLAITAFMVLPIYLIALAAFSSRSALDEFPQRFIPSAFSTETMSTFLSSTGVIPGLINSLRARADRPVRGRAGSGLL
jgi:multiple sugar transport system permease protein